MKKLLIGILMVCLALIGCSDSGGGSSSKEDEPEDPCDGPVPCLTEDWGDILDDGTWSGNYAVFYDSDNLIVLISDGETIGVAGVYEIEGETAIVSFEGPVINCYDADINWGGIDNDLDGIIDYIFTSASGRLNVCAETLKIYEFVIEGEVEEDVTATFDSMASLSASNHLITDVPISAENVEKVKIRIKLLKQLMEE